MEGPTKELQECTKAFEQTSKELVEAMRHLTDLTNQVRTKTSVLEDLKKSRERILEIITNKEKERQGYWDGLSDAEYFNAAKLNGCTESHNELWAGIQDMEHRIHDCAADYLEENDARLKSINTQLTMAEDMYITKSQVDEAERDVNHLEEQEMTQRTLVGNIETQLMQKKSKTLITLNDNVKY